MRTIGDKRTSRKHDRKVLVAEESTKSWAGTDSESSSSSSSSSASEQEEVHCLMADQTSDDELRSTLTLQLNFKIPPVASYSNLLLILSNRFAWLLRLVLTLSAI
ncbi:hypothetical protein F511_34792 [Dorcoceras hygrometricum]|uniref:Uncharacterized protein n=1 Tax=Dorcoceras hygrometricum TaxID=472368 RepID=A0A2Z7AS44_9LAMI|nr:hypothetical protein F511_34792 [Dorcoceras hygrometricum]